MTLPTTSLQALATDLQSGGAGIVPSEEEIVDLREGLARELAAVTNPETVWPDRPPGPLRITKRRLRTMAICPAQELPGPADERSLDLQQQIDLAVGTVCDTAAGLVSVSPRFHQGPGWYRAMRLALDYEHGELNAFVDALPEAERDEFEAVVDERCAVLPELLGELDAFWPTSHEKVVVGFEPPTDLSMRAELDLALRLTASTAKPAAVGQPALRRTLLVEVKSGQYSNWIPEELRHYGLLVALRDGRSPLLGCALTLKDARLTPVSLDLEALHLAARRVITTTEALVGVDRALAEQRPVPTAAGEHCRYCHRTSICPAVSDLVVADLEASQP